MKVGIISGTFDPVHDGHIAIAQLAINNLGLDEVWFMPERSPRSKQNVTSYDHRLKMLNLVAGSKVKILEAEHSSHSIDTLRALKDKNDFFILVGADVDIRNWHKIDEIRQLASIITFGRNGRVADIQFNNPASSKNIREQIAANKKPDNLNQKVLEYIYEHKIYKV